MTAFALERSITTAAATWCCRWMNQEARHKSPAAVAKEVGMGNPAEGNERPPGRNRVPKLAPVVKCVQSSSVAADLGTGGCIFGARTAGRSA